MKTITDRVRTFANRSVTNKILNSMQKLVIRIKFSCTLIGNNSQSFSGNTEVHLKLKQ
jgi:hypothetical protein